MIPDPCSRLFARLRRPDLGMGLGLGLGIGVSGRGNVNIDFSSGVLPSGMTFTRASSGTYFNALGVMVSAPINTARFDYSPTSIGAFLGLLIEPSATNLVLQSSTMPSGTWLDASTGTTTLTQGYAVAPDGTTTAVRLQGNNANTWWASPYSASSPASQTRTFSAYLKANVGAPSVGMNFLLNGGSSKIQSVALNSSLLRRSVSFTFSAGDNFPLSVALNIGNGNDMTGWGAQMELGPLATSYIPTTTVAATRATDVCSFTIPAGVSTLRYVFDNDSTQDVSVSPGAYQIPTNLNRSRIKRIVSL